MFPMISVNNLLAVTVVQKIKRNGAKPVSIVFFFSILSFFFLSR